MLEGAYGYGVKVLEGAYGYGVKVLEGALWSEGDIVLERIL